MTTETPESQQAAGDPGIRSSGVSGLDRFDAQAARFPAYIRGQRGLSENTLRVYQADLERLPPVSGI